MTRPDRPSDREEAEPTVGGAIRERPAVAAQAGLIAPLLGIALLLILGLLVNPWLGVAVGFATTLIALPLTIWFLARFRR